MSDYVNDELANIALEKADGFAFERFAQDFLSVLEGRSFVPLGGVQDGGADGLYECEDKRVFYQMTRQDNHRDKIRKTVTRLNKFGRSFRTIYYITSRLIPHIDKEEDLLSDELKVIVKIRDRKYIISHINDRSGTIAAYNNHLAMFTAYLNQIPKDNFSQYSVHVKDPSSYVFLQHEVTNRRGNRKLIHSLADSLIIWALSETNPDENIFMSEDEIRDKIFEQFPWAVKILKAHIRNRLLILRSKGESGKKIRWYSKHKYYCLPFETREQIKVENQHDESLKIKFLEELKVQASSVVDADDGIYQQLSELCSEVVHLLFEKKGLLFAHFLQEKDDIESIPVVSDCIDNVLENSDIVIEEVEQYREYMESILRSLFYHASPAQREFLNNLSRTYVLLFTLQTEPKVIEYFSSMSASFHLFLGSDILVKALSERFLDEEDQVARNLLKLSSAAGVSLYLSECVLDEVFTHIQGTYYEFINHFVEIEPYMTRELVRNCNKILIRSYFYAKSEGRVKGWKRFLNQFITYENITKEKGRDELRKYLTSEYNLRFIENDELEAKSNLKKVQQLADELMLNEDKKHESLAYNTALLVHGIYGIRKTNQESSGVSEFGLKTWWMTNQSRVLKHTGEIIRQHHAPYIMRPEYILNFIAMSPNCEAVREAFQSIFPSNFGIQLGHRLGEEVFHEIMAQVGNWKEYEDGRIKTLMADLSDKLKGDRLKRYEWNLDDVTRM